MKTRRLFRLAALASLAGGTAARAQTWRHTAANLGTSARDLIIGARPEDEDNSLIARLSLGRNVETAYLSITRGEGADNLVGTERQSALGVVRTAELLAERQRDGAHQYFTRAYDFGSTRSDSIVDAAWPHDSLLADVVAVVRAFRPHVIISTIADFGERDATRRMSARLAREAFADGDTSRLQQFSRLQAPVLLLPYLRAAPTGLTSLTRLGPVVLPPKERKSTATESAKAAPSARSGG